MLSSSRILSSSTFLVKSVKILIHRHILYAITAVVEVSTAVLIWMTLFSAVWLAPTSLWGYIHSRQKTATRALFCTHSQKHARTTSTSCPLLSCKILTAWFQRRRPQRHFWQLFIWKFIGFIECYLGLQRRRGYVGLGEVKSGYLLRACGHVYLATVRHSSYVSLVSTEAHGVFLPQSQGLPSRSCIL